MIGGMICPPVEATASTAAAKCGLKPVRFISGMEIGPSTITLATAEPEMVPNSDDDTTETLPGPPAGVAGDAHGEVHEQLAGAGALHEGAEQHEDHHVGGGDRQRLAEDALGRQVELVDEPDRLDAGEEIAVQP